MEVLADTFKDHFDQYGCKYYKSTISEIENLDARDIPWLADVGLPDGAIPFFFFDFYIGYLRDVDIPQCKMILGTAFEPTSHHYVIVDEHDKVYIEMESSTRVFVNSSVRQLCACVLQYSKWLEDQENLFSIDANHIVGPVQMFELYYRLRCIDRLAFKMETSIWPQLVHSEVNFLMEEE
jgi:hypothetical protein